MEDIKKRGRYAWVFFFLTALPLAVYYDVVTFSFVNWDDDVNIFENPYLSGFSLENLKGLWSGPYADLYIPVTYSVWFFTGFLGSLFSENPGTTLEPAFFHGANLLFHIVNGFLVFFILGFFTDARTGDKKSALPALTGALFFLLHPVQTEAVSWVTGMKDLLSGFFSLLCILTYLIFKTRDTGRNPPMSPPLLFFLAALLSKPSAVTLPLVIIAIECIWFKKSIFPGMLSLTPWFFCSLITTVISQMSQKDKITATLPLWKRVFTGVEAAGFYIVKLVFPFHPSADYGLSIDTFTGNDEFLLFCIVPALAILGTWKIGKGLFLPFVLFFLFLLPALGFVPFAFQSISIVADRYMYMGVFGVSIAVSLLCQRAQSQAFIPLISSTLLCFALLANSASQKWRTPYELFFNTVLANPNSYISYNNLGVYFFKKSEFTKAAHYFKQALSIKPDFLLSHFNLANTFALRNQPAEAAFHYNEALQVDPEHQQVNYNLGIVYSQMGNRLEAAKQFKKVVSINPGFAPAYFDLGNLLKEEEKNDEAITMFTLALKADSNLIEAHRNLGILYGKTGHEKKALESFQKAHSLEAGTSGRKN